MKTKFILALVTLILLTSQVKAQRDVPIAGNAANLIDLLKKDYNSIDPDTRGDALLKDRNQVVTIFKSFLTKEELKSFSDTDYSGETDAVKKSLKLYNNAKKENTAIATLTISVSDTEDVKQATSDAISRSDSTESLKNKYYYDQADLDLAQLNKLEHVYNGAKNKFIATVIDLFEQKYDQLNTAAIDDFAVANANGAVQKSLPFIGGDLNFTTLIDGLSKFLAKRIKEELTAYAMTEVSKLLKAPSGKDPFAEIKVLLPTTTGYLQSFTADKISNFPSDIKQYIEHDLDHILDDAINLKNTPRIAALISKHPDLDFAFEALEMIPNLSKIKQPVDYFSLLGSSRNIQRWKTDQSNLVTYNMSNAIQLMELLAYSGCVVENGETRFAGSNFWADHISEPNFLMLYLGFLSQQNTKFYNIAFQDAVGPYPLSHGLDGIVNSTFPTDDQLNFFSYLLTSIGKNGEKVYNSAADIKMASKNGTKVSADTIHSFVSSMIDLSKQIAYGVDTLLYSFDPNNPKKFNLVNVTDPYLFVASTANDVIYDIQKKKYADGLISLISVVDHFTGQDKNVDAAIAVNSLNLLKAIPNVANWTFVVNELNTLNVDLALNDVQARQFYLVAEDLNNLNTFLLNNGIAVPQDVANNINNFKQFAQKCYATKKIEFTDLNFAVAKTLVANENFKLYLISLFVNANVSALADKVGSEMEKLTYTDGNVTRTVFQPADITRFKSLLVSLAKEQYKELILNDHSSAAVDQADAVFKFLGFYLEDYNKWLPAKVSAQIDPIVVSLIHFTNDLAQAQNSGDVEQAIEAFALPAGSYAAKRTSIVNYSVNSYPGLFISKEYSYNQNTHSWATSGGFTAPIGLNVTWGSAAGYSIGVFVPIIDVGAVTRIRFSDANGAKALPDLTFTNILSPGAYLSFGLKNAPFSVNLGGQYGPQLKQIDTNNNPVFLDSFRFGIALVLDIPLFNLSTKPRLQ